MCVKNYSDMNVSPVRCLMRLACDSSQALSAAGPSPWSAISTCQTPPASPTVVTSIKIVSTYVFS